MALFIEFGLDDSLTDEIELLVYYLALEGRKPMSKVL